MLDRRDLVALESTSLVGVTVGVGSQLLLFASGASVMCQCPFECVDGLSRLSGHGEDVYTSVLFYEFLNQNVKSASFGGDGVLELVFDDSRVIRIIADKNGLESYVVSTLHGVCPVILF